MVYAIVAVIVMLLDQAVKYLTITDIPFETTRSFIPGFMELTNIHNTKMAFGLGIDYHSGWLAPPKGDGHARNDSHRR